VKVTVHTDRCIGSGMCVRTAPDVFDQDDDAVVSLLTTAPVATDEQAVRDAAARCPAEVIEVVEN
jgi:ferredoxin